MKKKISGREEVNGLYSKINSKIEDYIKIHKIRPSEIYSYISRRIEDFLEENDLDRIEGSERIVKDIIEHYRNLEMDGILKFERFLIKEELQIKTTSTNIDHEKVLADFYKTSLGHVILINKELHLYLVKDFGREHYAIIFSNDEISDIKNQVSQLIEKEVITKVLKLKKIGNLELKNPIKLPLSKMVNNSDIKELCLDILDEEDLREIIESEISSSDFLPDELKGDKLIWKANFLSHLIWEYRKN